MPAMCDHAADGSEKGDTTIDDGIVQDRSLFHSIRVKVAPITLKRQENKKLFITYKKPHYDASSQTIRRRIRSTLEESGTDVASFGAHNTRPASTSAVARKDINVETIRKTTGWTEKSATFARFYNQPFQSSEDFTRARTVRASSSPCEREGQASCDYHEQPLTATAYNTLFFPGEQEADKTGMPAVLSTWLQASPGHGNQCRKAHMLELPVQGGGQGHVGQALRDRKPPDKPTCFRPMCMLDAVSKILERIICDRLQVFTESPSGLSDREFCFRRGRSTIDAIETVVSTAREALKGRRWLGGTKEYCVAGRQKRVRHGAVELHSHRAGTHREACLPAENDFHYFQDRVLEYSTSDGPEAGSVTVGAPQRSVLGPTLWNVMYDIALVAVAKHLWLIENHLNVALAQAESIHRRACLRIISRRPHLSLEATYVLASIPPLELLADERTRLYDRRHDDAGRDDERQETLRRWQVQWDQSTKGRWTHRLIPDIKGWVERSSTLLKSTNPWLSLWSARPLDPLVLFHALGPTRTRTSTLHSDDVGSYYPHGTRQSDVDIPEDVALNSHTRAPFARAIIAAIQEKPQSNDPWYDRMYTTEHQHANAYPDWKIIEFTLRTHCATSQRVQSRTARRRLTFAHTRIYKFSGLPRRIGQLPREVEHHINDGSAVHRHLPRGVEGDNGSTSTTSTIRTA
ncbi:unnamed protein product, partial [Trichogramma brassicae]